MASDRRDCPDSSWNQGPFAPPALPGFITTAGLSATPYGHACSSRSPCCRSHADTAGASRVAFRFLFQTCRRHYPGGTAGRLSLGPPPTRLGGTPPHDGGLRRYSSGSAPTSPVSRLARRSLTLRPVCSLTPRGSLFLRCFSPIRYLLEPPQVLPAGATRCRAGFAPAGNNTPFTAH